MINKYTILDEYQIPKDLFLKFIDALKINVSLMEKVTSLKSKLSYLSTNTLNIDTFYLTTNFLNSNVSENRKRLLIDKDSTPRTLEEKQISIAKSVLSSIIKDATVNNLPLNSSDILSIIKKLTSKKIQFVSKDFIVKEKDAKVKKSVRFYFNEILEYYNTLLPRKDEEPLLLLSITIIEMYNMKPYSDENYLALVCFIYYSLLRIGYVAFKYVSFFELFIKYEEEIKESIIKASINYDQNVILYKPVVNSLLDLIIDASNTVLKDINNNNYEERINKIDAIKLTIMTKLPDIFSKEDITRQYPDVSLSTIMRALTELNKKEYVIPLGKGRSAKWKRIVDASSIKYLIGVDENGE